MFAYFCGCIEDLLKRELKFASRQKAHHNSQFSILNFQLLNDMSFYSRIVRPILFLFPAERVRNFSLGLLRTIGSSRFGEWLLSRLYGYRHPSLEREVFGVRFRNPIGSAAGIDRDARLYRPLGALGFGFVEIGSLTPKPQNGNPRPRLMRMRRAKALLHRMGEPNCGLEKAVERLRRRAHGRKVVVGANLAAGSLEMRENALKDYLRPFRSLYQYVDYFTINVTSLIGCDEDYTPEDRTFVESMLDSLFDFRRGQNDYRPILLKISPDWSYEQIDDMVKILIDTPLDGLVVSDCSRQFMGALSPREMGRAAGCVLGGAPLLERTIELIKYVCSKMDYSYPVIGVGGMMSSEDAQRMLDAGASLVQCYSAMVYEGPALPGRICRKLSEPARIAEKKHRKAYKNAKK